ncbi:MAG: hypothetical protein QXU92_01340, partial [Candidatus Diapherotrites archaeon]
MVKKKHEEEKDIFEKELQSENEEEKEEERFEDLDDDDFDFDVDYDSVDHEANKPKKQEIKETILSKAEIASNDSFFDEQAEKLSFIEEDKK